MRVATKEGGAVEGGFDRGKEEKKEIYIRDEIIIEARIKGMSRPSPPYPPLCKCKAEPPVFVLDLCKPFAL